MGKIGRQHFQNIYDFLANKTHRACKFFEFYGEHKFNFTWLKQAKLSSASFLKLLQIFYLVNFFGDFLLFFPTNSIKSLHTTDMPTMSEHKFILLEKRKYTFEIYHNIPSSWREGFHAYIL